MSGVRSLLNRARKVLGSLHDLPPEGGAFCEMVRQFLRLGRKPEDPWMANYLTKLEPFLEGSASVTPGVSASTIADLGEEDPALRYSYATGIFAAGRRKYRARPSK